jgi:hypothetical protein
MDLVNWKKLVKELKNECTVHRVHKGQNTLCEKIRNEIIQDRIEEIAILLSYKTKVILPCFLSRTDVENIITDVENKRFEQYRCGEYYHRCGECVFFLIACMGKRNPKITYI